MNKTEFVNLLTNPAEISAVQTTALEQVVATYPYFQSARALYLKGLYNLESFRYNYELKKTAAHTTDRAILFEFLTSSEFKTIQRKEVETAIPAIQNNEISKVSENNLVKNEDFEIESNLETIFGSSIFEEKTAASKDDNDSSNENILTSSASDNIIPAASEPLENSELIVTTTAKPFAFEKNETHSFNEWLKMTPTAPINRENFVEKSDLEIEKEKKENLIDKFIENNPKIPAIKQTVATPANLLNKAEKTSHLMTETLARIYLEQKKYQRAIQAYEILILKYPEKSSFFAVQIKNIKEIQNNNIK